MIYEDPAERDEKKRLLELLDGGSRKSQDDGKKEANLKKRGSGSETRRNGVRMAGF